MPLRRRLRGALRSLAAWPDAQGWRDCAAVSALAVAVLLLVAALSGLLVPSRADAAAWRILLDALLLPALVEEFVFRGLLTPGPGESDRPRTEAGVALALYVLWHIPGGFLLGAPVFLTPAFLAGTAILGAACGLMRLRTGSLWPGVFLHAAVVATWQAWFGGVDPVGLLA